MRNSIFHNRLLSEKSKVKEYVYDVLSFIYTKEEGGVILTLNNTLKTTLG